MTSRRYPPSYLPQHSTGVSWRPSQKSSSGWTIFNTRIYSSNPRYLYLRPISRFIRKRGLLLVFLFCFTFLGGLFLRTTFIWQLLPFTERSTLVYREEDLQRIVLWEIESGHGNRPVPGRVLKNPLPRKYLDIQHDNSTVAYPPRPIPGSIADMNIIMKNCDFSRQKLVRDCLEILRVGARLDNGNRLERDNIDDFKYVYLEERHNHNLDPLIPTNNIETSPPLRKKPNAKMEPSPITLPPTIPPRAYSDLSTSCDPDYPRIFHIFWTGPFTDKPYLALLSFLYTQNTGLHSGGLSKTCRPVMWVHINIGPAASVPNPSATSDMFKELSSNPWAAPFLHEQFSSLIQFKLWNTTEQLDGIPELRHEWRKMHTLFNSGGRIIDVPPEHADGNQDKLADDMLHRTGSKSSSSYDRLSVILSDMARFILCHRFGGIYLDADTILLRDWEEVWGWRGAFAYRWSRMTRYNTAVLHMNKGSALGTFLFRTALRNNLDFHPMTVSRYLKDAHLDDLLFRLPDALFDSAWLNTEFYQRDRPPQPYFKAFEDFFDTPPVNSAAPKALGFDGFFKGAFSYHYHNFWWKPFDPARDWPDLGSRNAVDKKVIREGMDDAATSDSGELAWSAVLKRTFESYIRGERPNMYGEWLLDWQE
ncbi:hypothetical protein BDP27DRAFT_1314019, partial [Rhodocollybia butyracea]